MFRKGLAISLLAATAAVVPALGMEQNVVKIDSSISIKSNGLHFGGRVRSDSAGCVPRRRVKLLRKQPGRDQVYGRDRTSRRGVWKITIDGFAGVSMSRFYAKVKKRSEGAAGTIYVCRSALSRAIKPNL